MSSIDYWTFKSFFFMSTTGADISRLPRFGEIRQGFESNALESTTLLTL